MIKEITEQKEWNEKYSQANSASGKFLQSWNWGEFQKSVGRKVIRFADDAAMAQIVELSLPFKKKYWFCPKGPISANGKEQMIKSFLKELTTKAKEAGVVFLRIEPVGKISGQMNHDISPRHTTIVDLAKSEDELLAAMHQKTRYNIRVADKHKVFVDSRFKNQDSRINELMNLFAATAKRDGFRLHPRAYYEKQIKMPDVAVYAAIYDEKILAAAIVISDGRTLTYLHGASSSELRNVMAPYALHWAIIKEAKSAGCRQYDLWGISDDPKSGWAGITRFKRGWGGTDFFAPGTYDLPVRRFWYSVYTLGRRLRP